VRYQGALWWLALSGVALAIAAPGLSSSRALAQSWLPWTTREEPPRRPQRRRTLPNFGQPRQPSFNNNKAYNGDRPSICLQLEQRLAVDARRFANAKETIQKLRRELNDARRKKRRAERDLDRRECYESFLFTRSLRPSRTCHRLDRQARAAKRQEEDLALELRDFQSGGGRGRQDEIVRALARNNCGANYQREARRRDPLTNFWQDNDGDTDRGTGNLFGGLPFATYRTVCVRLCDGYYFPVSFSTLPTHFERDVEKCQSQCAAPAELYFHQNPGGSVEQMISQRTERPYTSLKTAFRYRKEFVASCSCKASEYVPQVAGNNVGPVPAPQPAQPAPEPDKLSPVRR